MARMSSHEQSTPDPGVHNGSSTLLARVCNKTASTAMGVATSAATAAIPIAKATAVAMLQRHDFAAEQFVGQAKSLILKYATYCNKYVVATRTSKCVQQQDGTAMDLQHRDAGKLPLAAGCQKQLVALQALLTQLEAELVLAASAAEPPETRDARRTRYWTLFKWLGMSQPQPDQRAGQDALPYGPEAAHSEADRTDLYGLSVEQREAFIDQLLARGNGMQDGVWHDSFELLRMTLPGSGHILTAFSNNRKRSNHILHWFLALMVSLLAKPAARGRVLSFLQKLRLKVQQVQNEISVLKRVLASTSAHGPDSL